MQPPSPHTLQVRRAGMQLLKLVALPAGSDAAARMLNVLGCKACDKDPNVRACALELLLQLPVEMLVSGLSEGEWLGVVAGGLRSLAGGGGSEGGKRVAGGGRKGPALSEEARSAFWQLLRRVLLAGAGGAGVAPTHSGSPFMLQAKQALLRLLCDREIEIVLSDACHWLQAGA